MIHHRERAAGVDQRLQDWLDKAGAELPFDLTVTAGVRTAEEQEALYAQGRTTPGNIVTHAHATESAHCHRGAVDVAPLVHGAIPWNSTDPGYELWQQMGHHALLAGLDWGGSGIGGWAHFHDMPHVEVQNWRDLPLAS